LALTVLVLVAVALNLLLASPFASPLFMAAVLAGALQGPQAWLARRRGMRPGAAAAALVLGVLFAVVLPFASLGALLVGEVVSGVGAIAALLHDGGVPNLVDHLPSLLRGPVERLVRELGGLAGDGASITQRLGQAAAALEGVFAVTGTALSVVLKSALMLVATYFLLVDGAALVAWVEAISPFPPGEARTLLAEFRHVSVTVLRSTLLTALVQSVTAWVGFAIAHAPKPLVLAFVTFLLALVPAIGAASGGLLGALLMLALGKPWAALFLALWAVFAVGLIDNLVKPLFIRGGVDVHGAVIFFSLLGGIAVFGPVGLLAGPLVPSFLLAALRMRARARTFGPP
jgi:predicted PurR-regulated permease PerM